MKNKNKDKNWQDPTHPIKYQKPECKFSCLVFLTGYNIEEDFSLTLLTMIGFSPVKYDSLIWYLVSQAVLHLISIPWVSFIII